MNDQVGGRVNELFQDIILTTFLWTEENYETLAHDSKEFEQIGPTA
jgi:hypothetical protein